MSGEDRHVDSDRLACELVEQVSSQTLVTLVLESVPHKMLRTDNPFWHKPARGVPGRWTILKKSQLNGPIGSSYASTVRARQKKQRDQFETRPQTGQAAFEWKPRPRTWGQRMKPTPLVVYANSLYLDFHKVNEFACKFIDRETGDDIPIEDVRPFIPVPPSLRAACERQDLLPEQIVEWRCPGLRSIRYAAFLGTRYHVTPALRSEERKAAERKAAGKAA